MLVNPHDLQDVSTCAFPVSLPLRKPDETWLTLSVWVNNVSLHNIPFPFIISPANALSA